MSARRACVALGGLLLHSAVGMNADVEAMLQGSMQLSEADDVETKHESPPPTGTVWAPVKYMWKEPVEALSSTGTWIKCKVEGSGVYFGFYHLTCAANSIPGQSDDYFLPNVPYKYIRRALDVNDKDFVLMNNVNAPGKGIRYRYSMDMNDAGGEIAPWGQVVVGEDVDAQWIKTDRGYYLPKMINTAHVLYEQARPDAVWTPADLSGSVFADMRAKAKDLTDHTFDVGEHALYKTKRGEWIKCRIAAKEKYGLYAIIAMPVEYAMYPVGGVFPDHLKKVEHVAEPHVPSANETKLCQKDGCISIMANTSTVMSRRAYVVQLPKKSNLKMLMTMICQKVMKEFKTCINETQFKFNGQQLDPSMRTEDSGLDDQSVIVVKTAAEVQAEKERERELEKQKKARQEAKAQIEVLRKAAAKHPQNQNLQKAVAKVMKKATAKISRHGGKPLAPAKKTAHAQIKKPVSKVSTGSEAKKA